MYGGDSGGTRFSPLREINRSNVAKLKPAWTYHMATLATAASIPLEAHSKRLLSMIDGFSTLLPSSTD